MSLYTRPIHREDESFLFQVYASTRSEEIAGWGWDQETIRTFLTMQWNAQQRSYIAQYPELQQYILCADNLQIGRVIISRTEHTLTLVDLALLPEHQNQKHGTKLVQQLQQEAATSCKKLRLSVLKMNRANSLYSRLGFRLTGGNELYNFMEWTPHQ